MVVTKATVTETPALTPGAPTSHLDKAQPFGSRTAVSVLGRSDSSDSTSHGFGSDSSGTTIISFAKDDPGCPYNWSEKRKTLIVFTSIVIVINSTLGSSLPSGATSIIANEFGVDTDGANLELVLPISVFLLGYVLGPLLFGPLSEWSGRRFPIILTFVGYTMSLLGCALVNSWAGFLIFRFLGGVFGSAPIAIVGGVFADIYRDPGSRGRAMTVFMATVICAPLVSPIITGFVSSRPWRWIFWIALMFAGLSWPPLLFLPETFAPVILSRRAAGMRKAAYVKGNSAPNIYAPIDVESRCWRHLFTVVLARPLRMMATEMIVFAVCLYLSIAYAIFYMCFQSYPLIFGGIYEMSPKISGLMFLPIGGGTMLAFCIVFYYDRFLEKSRQERKPWTQKEENRRLPLSCLGGPLYVIALLWLGWTARSDVPWAIPFLAGIPLGMGTLLIFIGLLNYLADAYTIYAASAMAAAACCRSIFGSVLPLAAVPMYKAWGIGWASTFLALLSLIMSAVPFAFIRYRDIMRRRSAFCCMVQQQRAVENNEPKEKQVKKAASESQQAMA